MARLMAGPSPLQPRIKTLSSEFLDGAQSERLRKRLAVWLDRHLSGSLAPLLQAEDTNLSGSARGLLFQLIEAMGTLPRRPLAGQIGPMTKADRKALAALGVRLGAQSVFFPALMKARSSRLRALLWSVFHTPAYSPPARFSPPSDGRAYRPPPGGLDVDLPESAYLAAGYRRIRRDGACLAVRADRLEQVVRELHKHAAKGSFSLTPEICRRLALEAGDLALLLPSIGFQVTPGEAGMTVIARGRRKENGGRPVGAKGAPENQLATATGKPTKVRGKRTPRGAAAKARRAPGADSPFAKLRQIKADS